jgi:hypothetical protein
LAYCLAAVHAPAATVAQAAEFLDVDVHELAGTLALVAADDPPRRAIHPAESRDAVAGEHSVHGRRRDAELVADPRRAELARSAKRAIRDSSSTGTRLGDRYGRDERSSNAA